MYQRYGQNSSFPNSRSFFNVFSNCEEFHVNLTPRTEDCLVDDGIGLKVHQPRFMGRELFRGFLRCS